MYVRSGDISAVQPKAAGSSIINKLTTALVKDLFWSVLGMKSLKGFLLVPVATGMAITLGEYFELRHVRLYAAQASFIPL